MSFTGNRLFSLFVPILSLNQVLAYSHGSYEVLVLCSDAVTYKHSVLFEEYEEATPQEIEIARKTLTDFVLGVASYLVDVISQSALSKVPEFEQRKVLATKTALTTSRMARLTLSTKRLNLNVLKVRFSNSNPGLHPETDPCCLFLKSAMNWSSMQGQTLLPGGLSPHNCEECLEKELFQVCVMYMIQWCQFHLKFPFCTIPDLCLYLVFHVYRKYLGASWKHLSCTAGDSQSDSWLLMNKPRDHCSRDGAFMSVDQATS